MNNKVRILSIDGGGIRGIIPATILEYMEHKLSELTGNRNARIADFFDLIVGTSTGGILACFYLTPNPSLKNQEANSQKTIPASKYPAKKALDFYVEKGDQIFTKARNNSWLGIRQMFNATKFRKNNIEKVFNEEFGDLKMTELLKPCMVTSYNLITQSVVYFKSWKTESDREYRVKDVVRSTSAAPTYFPPAFISDLNDGHQMINLDGGVCANNPAMCAYVAARDTDFGKIKNPAAKDMVFLSLGTGGGRIKFPEEKKSEKWGVISWAKAAPDIMMDGAAEIINYQLKAIFGTLDEENKKHYKRVDVPFDIRKNYSFDMSDASPDNIAALKEAGEKTREDARKRKKDELTLDEFILLLLE